MRYIINGVKETEKLAINFLKGVPIGIKKEKANTLKSMSEVSEELLDEFDLNVKDNLTNNLPKKVTQSDNGNILEINYEKLSNAIVNSLNKCKLTIDGDGFAKIVQDEIYKVV